MILKPGKEAKKAYQIHISLPASHVDIKAHCAVHSTFKLRADEVEYAMSHGLKELIAKGLVEEVKAASAKVEAPKVETPKPVPVKVEAPKVEAPVEAPKVEEPKVEAPAEEAKPKRGKKTEEPK